MIGLWLYRKIMDKRLLAVLGVLFAIPAMASESMSDEKNIGSDAADARGTENVKVTVVSSETLLTSLTDTSRVFNLDEIVVVSQPKEVMSLRRQPLSSTVFTSRELSQTGVRDLSELSSYVPSFSMPSYGSRLTSSMYIRGIGSRVNSPAVGIYLDGIPLVGKGSFNFHSYQLDRVDVLRGPQGTLYGMNTEGGLVRMYSKNPMAYQGSDFKISAGTHFYRNVEFSHYSKFGEKLGLSLAGFYDGQNGFFRNFTTGQRADLYNEAGGKSRLVWLLTDRLTLDFVADYQYVCQNGFPYGLLSLNDNSVAAPAGNRQNKYRRNMFNVGLNLGYSADAFLFNSATSYQFQSDKMNMDQDYLPQDYMHLQQRQLMNALTQEFSLKSRNDGAWKWTSGMYGSYQWLKTDAPVFFDDDFCTFLGNTVQTAMYNAMVRSMASKGMTEDAAKVLIERRGGVSFGVDKMEVPSLFHTPQFNLGVFHESTINLTDLFAVTIGLRYDYSHVSIDYSAKSAMAFAASVMGTGVKGKLSSILKNSTGNDYNQLLPKIGIDYTLSDDGSNVYATVSKGYRAGGYNIQMFSDILQAELNANYTKAMNGDYEIEHTTEDYENVNKTIAYKPEESWNYEAGAHLNLFNNRLHMDISAYYMQIRNQQLSVMAGNYGFGRTMVNAGKSYSCGFEVAFRGSAFENNLSWSASYGLTHAAFKEYTDVINGETIDYKDKRVPFIPMHTLNARADYRFLFSGLIVRSLEFGADVTAQGRIYWDEANTYSQPFYALIGVHANMIFEHVGLRLWCRNLTDTKFNTFAFDSSASGSKLYFAQRGTPFQAGFDLTFHF